MTTTELAELRRLADACFVGPWRYESFTVRCENVEHADSGYEDCDGEHDVIRITSPDEYPSEQVIADVPGLEQFARAHGEFIAAARTAIPRLVDEVQRLTAERDAAVRGDATYAQAVANDSVVTELRAEVERLREALWASTVFAEDIREWARPEHQFTWEDNYKESVQERASAIAIKARVALSPTATTGASSLPSALADDSE